MEEQKYKINLESVITVTNKDKLEYIYWSDINNRISCVFKVDRLGMDEIKSFLENLSGNTGIKI